MERWWVHESGYYTKGSLVTLRAIPARGYMFTRWSGDASGFEEEITVVVNSDMHVRANFSRITQEQGPFLGEGTKFSPLTPEQGPPQRSTLGQPFSL
jgi:hypothetical protein